jgi:HK97 family phage major capsid protein
MSPKTVAAYSDYTRQLALQASLSVEQLVKSDLALAIALAVDGAALNGTGNDSQPQGILQRSDTLLYEIGDNGGALSLTGVIGMESKVADANADIGNLAYIFNSQTRATLKATPKFQYANIAVWEGETVNGYFAGCSNQLPSNLTKGDGTALSAGIFGNWSDLVIGQWGPGLDIIVNPYTLAESGTIRVVVYFMCDIAIRHAESFCNCVDIVTGNN